jgi:hypothetical protein
MKRARFFRVVVGCKFMKIEIESAQTLSLERKIKMHEAREGIIDRLARDLPTNIDLERFLNVVVSEIGRMMDADRCDLLQLSEGSELRISHEWRKDESVPQSLGTAIPFDAAKLTEKFDFTRPIRMNDTSRTEDATVKFFTKALETQSLLIVPITLNEKVIGLLGLHDTHAPREWLDEEVAFLESVGRQLAVGYQYTRLYVAQEQETRRTNALLEIANTLNSHSDFNEVSARVLERAVELVGASYGALGVLDQTGKKFTLASFKSAPNVEPNAVLQMIEEHNQSLDIEPFPALGDILREGKTQRILDKDLPFAVRFQLAARRPRRARRAGARRRAGVRAFGFRLERRARRL